MRDMPTTQAKPTKDTHYSRLTPEQRKKYNLNNARKKRERTAREREDRAKREMLKKLLTTRAVEKKRELVESFNPFHYQFGYKLDPKNPYDQLREELYANS